MKRRFASMAGSTALAALIAGGLAGAPALAAEKDGKAANKGADQAAQSECLQELKQVRDDLSKNREFRKAYSAGQFGRGSFNDLVDAAQVFARNGMEERCQTVVAGIKEMAAKTGQGDRAKMTDEQRQAQQQQWAKQLKRAQPVDKAEISAETLTGIDVRNTQGEDLGDVADIIVSNGKVEAVIISRGGFLGIGETNHRLAANKARITTRQQVDDQADNNRATNNRATNNRSTDNRGTNNRSTDNRAANNRAANNRATNDRTIDAGDIVLVVEMSEDEIKGLPRVTKQNGRWMAAAAEDSDKPTGKTPPKENMRKKQ